MKSFTTFRFVFAMLVATGLLISAFILLYSYSSDNEIKKNLLDNTSVNSVSADESVNKANSNNKITEVPVDSNGKQFSQKSKTPLPAANKK